MPPLLQLLPLLLRPQGLPSLSTVFCGLEHVQCTLPANNAGRYCCVRTALNTSDIHARTAALLTCGCVASSSSCCHDSSSFAFCTAAQWQHQQHTVSCSVPLRELLASSASTIVTGTADAAN
eukprot:12583-Heterococcus_DN1.PRE.2